MIIQFTLQSTTDGSFLTGQASNTTVYISKDGGAFAATTNAVAEIGRGSYKVELTDAESAFSTLTYQPVCVGAQTNTYAIDAPIDVSGLATSSALADVATTANGIKAKTDNLPTVPAAKSDIPSVQTIQSGLAKSSELSTVATNVSAIKAKTDNLPSSPAAVGSEMALNTTAISAVQNGLATITATDALAHGLDTLSDWGDAHWSTANVSGLATLGSIENLATYGDAHWATADVSDIPTAEENAAAVWGAETRTITDSPDIQAELTTYGAAKTSDIPTAQDIWEYPDRELTSEISVDISAQNIKDITDSVWDADDRTLTDLTPKPNMKNIACTPSNVINAYGVPRLENWTNETAGTQAFDDKINTYITLAKEKMATDLNNQINAAIAYIGADNITELCAWLTGYNLYQDDESTDTDNLPETRYNQYLEQIHRIMENI